MGTPAPHAAVQSAPLMHGARARPQVVLNDIHIDIMDYIAPATCADVQFRSMWAEFEWENKARANPDPSPPQGARAAASGWRAGATAGQLQACRAPLQQGQKGVPPAARALARRHHLPAQPSFSMLGASDCLACEPAPSC